MMGFSFRAEKGREGGREERRTAFPQKKKRLEGERKRKKKRKDGDREGELSDGESENEGRS